MGQVWVRGVARDFIKDRNSRAEPGGMHEHGHGDENGNGEDWEVHGCEWVTLF